MKPFVVNVADLMHKPSARRAETLHGPTAELVVTQTIVAEGSQLDLVAMLSSVSDGVLATGSASVAWTSTCRRCLQPIERRAEVEFKEMYSDHPIEGETYPIVHDMVDLELVAREAILLDLPLAPVCREECAGLCPTCGTDLNEGPCTCTPIAVDPRWAALEGLRIQVTPAEDES